MRLFGRTALWARRRKIGTGVKRSYFKNKVKWTLFSNINFPKLGFLRKTKLAALADVQSKLRRGTRENFTTNGSFHEAIAPVLVMAQCFSIMPVKNVTAKTVAQLNFSWWSASAIYGCSFTVGSILFNLIVISWFFSSEIDFDKIVPVIFYTSCTYARIYFIILAMKWPALMTYWRKIEKKLPRHESIREQSELAYKIKMTSIVIMTLSLTEHLLNIISIVSHLNTCHKDLTDPIQLCFLIEQNQLFYYFDFSRMLAFVGKLLNITSTFLWSYMDLFVIVISLGLSSSFKQINDNLLKHKGQNMPEKFWIENRINYRKICRLCETIDKAIGPITMVSFGNNLYFVCVQLLRSLNPMASTAHAVYFWFSLIFLITRTLAVSLYSSAVNDQSKVPIRIFRACPTDSWCLEVKRFCDEVTTDTVALSGMHFFYLTRKLVLSVVGTIVTYELVLIQFRKISDKATDGC